MTNVPSLPLIKYFVNLISSVSSDVLFDIAIKEHAEGTEEALDIVIAEAYGLQIKNLVYTSLQRARGNRNEWD